MGQRYREGFSKLRAETMVGTKMSRASLLVVRETGLPLRRCAHPSAPQCARLVGSPTTTSTSCPWCLAQATAQGTAGLPPSPDPDFRPTPPPATKPWGYRVGPRLLSRDLLGMGSLYICEASFLTADNMRRRRYNPDNQYVFALSLGPLGDSCIAHRAANRTTASGKTQQR